jgi:AcrR family transcriptional regulator
MPPETMNPKTKATQDSLIKAAYELFSEQGYSKTTTKEISERAGVAELTLFRHFQTKQNVYKAVYMRYSPIQKVEQGLLEIEHLPFQEGLQYIINLLIQHMKDNRQFIILVTQEAPSIPEVQSIVNPLTIHNELVLRMVQLLRKGVEQGEVRQELDLGQVANTLLCILCSFLVLLSTGKLKPQIPPEAMCQTAIDCFVRGLRP